VANVEIAGVPQEAQPDELLIDLINRTGGAIPHVCYHPQLGPVQTCDAYMVEENGRLIRACATAVADGMKISTKSAKAKAAQAPIGIFGLLYDTSAKIIYAVWLQPLISYEPLVATCKRRRIRCQDINRLQSTKL
jgi:hypothetical protein